ncbi:MAG: glycosyltransferase [Pseudomonadota bacterium]
MRILHYNWADYHDPAGRGGGVTVYQRSTLAAFARMEGIEATFLSAGLAQSLRPGPPTWEALPPVPGDPTRRFRMVDTLPLSPAHHAFGCPEQVDHGPTVEAFARFVAQEGPFDVIQFNTLEGLPASVLTLRARWPDTRFVVAMHNYYPFCPQVNLWQRERAHCADFAAGTACVSCLPVRRNPARLRTLYGAVRTLESMGIGKGTFLYEHALQPAVRSGVALIRKMSDRRRAVVAEVEGPAPDAAPEHVSGAGAAFAARRHAFVAQLNAHADSVLAVSDRTAEVARAFGVQAERITVRRIGTDHAPLFDQTPPPAWLPAADGTLHLAYLGYMRRDKGFFFLLQALEALPEAVAARLRVTVAAQTRDTEAVRRLQALTPKLAQLRHFEGYTRDALGMVLEGIDLGVVPVLWEDNLPQVAMEMHARRIPLLTSDRGGARELGNTSDLVFRAGDAADFQRALTRVLQGGLDLAAYWANARALDSPAQHAEALIELYAHLLGQVASNERARSRRTDAEPDA